MRHVRHDEEGAALLFALVFLLLFAVAVPALLGLSFSSIRYATAVEDRGLVAYAGDGGVEATIANLRANPALGVEGGPGCDGTVTLNGTPVLVRCAPQPGSGKVTTTGGGGTANPLNTPGQAIMVTGTDPGEIGLEKSSNSDVVVGGTVLSRNAITVQTSSVLKVTGDVRSRLGCDADRITATGTTNCAAPDFAVPAWAPELTSLPTRRTAPGCTAPLLVLTPGFYDDAAALNALTDGSCPNRTIHFAPGAYYFEFTGTTREWSLTDPSTQVVGGTLTALANDCVPDAPAGIQWVFGGDSRVRIHDGKLNLCATPHTDSQRIAIHGLNAAIGVVPATTLAPATSTIQTTTGWATVPDTAGRNGSELAGDGRHVEVIRTSGATPTTLTQTFNNTALPEGAIIEQALVRVVHQETPVNRTVDPVLTLAATTSTGSSTSSYNVAESATQWTTQDIDATSWFAADPARFTSPTLTYAVNGSNAKDAGTLRLDGTSIIVRYRVPGMNPGSGCITERFAAGCPLITTVGNPTRLIVRGTIYAPNASLDLQATNQSEQVADRGLVARAIRLAVTASAPADYQMVSIPSDSDDPVVTTTADREVILTACPRDPVTLDCRKRADGTDEVLVTTQVRFPDTSGPPTIVRWFVS